ncbi:PmoA family protein [Streptomyces aurantiacus]|uniref:Oxidoreductase n=1 Tax=Streptomyces aurantiacus JA 4570 TaxID=1286094 RepID=S3ZEC9_9ACTN|nr:PmoA family protein [Streptomyces aurantiacus]EPH42011.1 hypothetical protein STRAU_4898 [Streptomyces aurantiacus JA 4570]
MNHSLIPRSLVLRCSGRPVVRYVVRPEVDRRHAPRPYLHPVSTLSGRTVTDLSPDDHPHHLGASVAVPDVAGSNFWGGRTFVRDQGPVDLENHGTQRHQGFKLHDPDGFVEELVWAAGGEVLLRERRTVAAVALTASAWALDFTFALTNATGADLSIGSPATNGRRGAAYGGFFWRAPKEAKPPEVFTAAADGEVRAHAACADWLALAGDGWTLVFAGATARTRRDPWFVRAADYPGVGSSLASTDRLPVAQGETVVRRVVTVVADGRPGRDEVAALARKAVTA